MLIRLDKQDRKLVQRNKVGSSARRICVEKECTQDFPGFPVRCSRQVCAAFFTESRMELLDSNKLSQL